MNFYFNNVKKLIGLCMKKIFSILAFFLLPTSMLGSEYDFFVNQKKYNIDFGDMFCVDKKDPEIQYMNDFVEDQHNIYNHHASIFFDNTLTNLQFLIVR